MNKLGKICFILSAAFLIFFSAETAFAQNDPEPDVFASCKDYPGLVNKIVKCITHLVEYEVVEGLLDRVHEIFVQVSNAAIVLYILFFGLKLMLGGVERVKSEIFIVSITAILVLYMNNTTRIMDVLDLFILGQSEFANAATAAISTSPVQNGSSIELICVGPNDGNGNPILDGAGNRVTFGTWQRVDCMIGYILGVHPLFERTSQYFEETDTEEDATGKQRFDYGLFASDENPFANMAEDPFEFLTDPDGAEITENYESFISFSMISIMVGMLFSDSMGIIVMLTGLFIIFLMIAAFGQAVLVYLTALFAMIVLAMFAPIIIPMFLFRTTRRVFDFWLQMFFTYMLQPGIMLAYLSFMLFVLQYVVQYSGDGVDSRNLIQYHFGDVYINAKKENRTALSIMNDSTSQFQESSADLVDETQKLSSQYTDYKDRNTYLYPTLVGNVPMQQKEGERGVAERTNFLNTIFKTYSGTDTNSSLMSTSGIKIPNFKFDTNHDVQEKLLNYMGVSASSMNPTEFMRALQKDPAFVEELADEQAQQESEEFQHSVSYMQTLLVVFLTMAVTFAFMQNVMAFGSEMAGAGTLPVNQMVNIYNGYTTKMAGSLK